MTLDDWKYYAWIYPFHGGISYFPSIWWALGAIVVFGALYRNRVSVGTPFLVPGDAVKWFHPTHGLAVGGDAHCCPIPLLTRVGLGVLVSASIFVKLGFFNVRVWGTSWTAVTVALNWFIGGYFLAGWGWIAIHCPLWKLNCL